MFEIGLADDAGLAVGTAQGMVEGELFEPENPVPSSGELGGGGRTHTAQTDDDGIVVDHIRINTFFLYIQYRASQRIMKAATAWKKFPVMPMRASPWKRIAAISSKRMK